ncbi:unnamed protein product [Trifolium pratense]|uniref:Uncharacterized protein n=1 Tax=Trifolium pratense TaxID=57577 RepID=A0ACB0J7U2_TRIPR|nr:unnamed protein product [Trifolium pratense]
MVFSNVIGFSNTVPKCKIPSVLAALFPINHVFGDPSQWLPVCSDLDSIKSVIRARNIKLVVVLVHTNANDVVSEDRMIALRKRAELEAKYVVILMNPNDESALQLSLNRYGMVYW